MGMAGMGQPKAVALYRRFAAGLRSVGARSVMLRLAVPDDQILCTSYHAWNDFLNPENQLATMDFRGVLLSKDDCLQATIPQIKARSVRRARPMPMPRDTRRQILRNPHFRHLLIPPKSTPQ